MKLRLSPLAALLLSAIVVQGEDDPLAGWRSGVRVHPVAPDFERHSIHSYFNTCPESPDGQWVLFFTSTAADGQSGEVRIRHRITGEERVLVRDLGVEDAHRAACQQWVSGGRHVVFHGERQGNWFVGLADPATGEEHVAAPGRLCCWGQAKGDLVPLYSPHWAPGEHRDLELLDASTGKITTVVTADSVKAAFPAWWTKSFGDKPASIFFPILSPDCTRVFFKMAASGNGNPRSSGASARQGLVCYDLAGQRFVFQRESWGHPAWHPDSRHIVEVGWNLIDTDTGKMHAAPGLPPMGSGHPSSSPDAKLIVTDLTADHLGGVKSDWSIVVADARGQSHVVLHTFDNSHGAKSWRVSHPHPVFSADGQRIYFNVSSGRWTQLYVAEKAH